MAALDIETIKSKARAKVNEELEEEAVKLPEGKYDELSKAKFVVDNIEREITHLEDNLVEIATESLAKKAK